MKPHLHGALRADRGQHEQQRGVRQPAWPVCWAGLLLSARHHNKQPSPRVTHALPMSQGNKEPVRGLPVRIEANRNKKKKKKQKRNRREKTRGGGVEDRARFEGVGEGGRAKSSTCKRLRREQGELQNCREDRPSVADTWTSGWELATRQRGTLRIYGPSYASSAGPLGTGWQVRLQWDHGRAAPRRAHCPDQSRGD